MKRILVVLLIISMLFSLVACGTGNSVVGKWAFGINTFEFKDDNTVSISVNAVLNYDGTYTVEKDKITVTATGVTGEVSEEFTYSLSGDTLTLTGDITLMGGTPTTIDFTRVAANEGSNASAEEGFFAKIFGYISSFIKTGSFNGNSGAASTDEDEDDDHTHEYSKATCTKPKTCSCGKTSGEPLGHHFVEGYCTVCYVGEYDDVRDALVVGNMVRVRLAPGTDAEVLYFEESAVQLNVGHPVLVYGDKVTCNDKEYPDWYRVSFEFDGYYFDGYMSCEFVTLVVTDENSYDTHEHWFSVRTVKEATCKTRGEKIYTCSCGHSYIESTGKTTYHNWKEATCTSPRTCRDCKKTEGRAYGHSYYNGWCTRCGEYDDSDY